MSARRSSPAAIRPRAASAVRPLSACRPPPETPSAATAAVSSFRRVYGPQPVEQPASGKRARTAQEHHRKEVADKVVSGIVDRTNELRGSGTKRGRGKHGKRAAR